LVISLPSALWQARDECPRHLHAWKNHGIMREPTDGYVSQVHPFRTHHESAAMRTHGTLAQWNDDRGVGFIETDVETEQLFVLISAFPRDGIRPRIGELISFEIDVRGDGKKRAVRVMRPGSRASVRRTRRPRSSTARQGPLTVVVSLLLLTIAGWYGYSRLTAPMPSTALHSRLPRRTRRRQRPWRPTNLSIATVVPAAHK